MTNPERALIASILLDPANSWEALDRRGITPSDFIHSETRLMLVELLAMREAGDPIDQAALAVKMPERYKTDPWEVTSEVRTPSADFYALAVMEVSKRHQLATLAQELAQVAGSQDSDLEAGIDRALSTLSKTQGKGLATQSLTLRQAAAQVIDNLDKPTRSIPTPFPALNEVLGGFRPGAFYVIAARPGVGKSMLGLQLAASIANPETQVAFFSFEMNAQELASRALASAGKINLTKIDRRNLTETEKQSLSLTHKELTDSLYLISTPSRQVTELRPALRAININTKGNLKAVFIDYLGLMEAKGSSLYERVSAISGQLKSLAMELDIPIIALAQLSRKAEERQGPPSLADLRDSGSIEQDADLVLMLSNDPQGNLTLTIQKNRQGPLGSFTGLVDRPTMTLKDLIKD
jgi:replicative DNA helicase